MTLRPAGPADLPVIFRAERDYIRAIEPDQEAAWTAATDRHLELWIANLDRATVLLAGTETAGFVIWMPAPAYRDGAATLVTIQVLPPCRRRGYGRVLLGVFTEQATATATTCCTTWTARSRGGKRETCGGHFTKGQTPDSGTIG
jgi:GNAT superfamily N-acetyltransferase